MVLDNPKFVQCDFIPREKINFENIYIKHNKSFKYVYKDMCTKLYVPTEPLQACTLCPSGVPDMLCRNSKSSSFVSLLFVVSANYVDWNVKVCHCRSFHLKH